MYHPKYSRAVQKDYESFCTACRSNDAFDNLMNEVINIDGDKVPFFVTLLQTKGTKPTKDQIRILNRMLVWWMSNLKMKHTNKKGVEHYQPITQTKKLRQCLTYLSQNFDMNYCLDDFKFDGSVVAQVNALYNNRLKTYGKVSFI